MLSHAVPYQVDSDMTIALPLMLLALSLGPARATRHRATEVHGVVYVDRNVNGPGVHNRQPYAFSADARARV